MAATAVQNRLFILGLGLSACLAIRLMRSLLVHYRDASIIPPIEPKPQYITQAVEDSLRLSTLHKLLDSPNYSIQEITNVIICERALHDTSAIDTLLWSVAQKAYTRRDEGVRALDMIASQSLELINKPKVYAALTKALEYCITDYEHQPYDPEWDNFGLRDAVERYCLQLLIQLVNYFGVDGLVKARFIERWLVRENWGEGEDAQMCFLETVSKGDHHRLNELLIPLVQSDEGRKQLEEAGLIPVMRSIRRRRTQPMNLDLGADDHSGMSMDRRRRRNQSTDEEHLRRRHREAMVLNDGTRPLERGDIFERER